MGFVSAFLCTVFLSSKDILSKKLALRVDGTVSTFASFAFALPYYVVVLGIAYLLGGEDFITQPGFYTFILLRSLSDTAAEWMKMYALAIGDLSVVSSLLALYPIILIIIAPLITGDQVSGDMIIATLVSVAGTAIVLYKPPQGREPMNWKAIGLSLGAALFFSINTSLDRLAAQAGSPLYSGFCMTLIAALFVAPAYFKIPVANEQLRKEWRLFSARGFFEVGFMVTKLAALRSLSAPVVVAISRFSLIFSIIGGKVVFKEKHFPRRLTGGILVVAGAILAMLAESQ